MADGETIKKLRAFVEARNWGQFHTPENLPKSISIEAAELLETYQWGKPDSTERVHEELADVLTYCYLLADSLGKDPERLILEKLVVTEGKYPVEKARGSSKKYDRL